MPTLNVSPLSAQVSAAPQLLPADMAAVAAAGYLSVINNRPDGEGGAVQPTSSDIEVAAKSVGLAYAHLPVAPSMQTPAEARALAQLLATMPAPVLMFCRSGARSTKLFNAAQAG